MMDAGVERSARDLLVDRFSEEGELRKLGRRTRSRASLARSDDSRTRSAP